MTTWTGTLPLRLWAESPGEYRLPLGILPVRASLLRFMCRTAVTLLVFVGPLLAMSQEDATDQHWIADSQGCKFFNRSPQPKESINWSGACVNGYGDGEGQLSWFLDGKPAGTYIGQLRAGRLDGTGTYRYRSGDQYEGGFYAGEYDGHGFYRFAEGARYEGEFVEGISSRHGVVQLTDGQRVESDFVVARVRRSDSYSAQLTLLVICFDDYNRLMKQVMIQSSGFPLLDEQAMDMVRMRPFDIHRLANEPISGCHMLGVTFENNEPYFILPRK